MNRSGVASLLSERGVTGAQDQAEALNALKDASQAAAAAVVKFAMAAPEGEALEELLDYYLPTTGPLNPNAGLLLDTLCAMVIRSHNAELFDPLTILCRAIQLQSIRKIPRLSKLVGSQSHSRTVGPKALALFEVMSRGSEEQALQVHAGIELRGKVIDRYATGEVRPHLVKLAVRVLQLQQPMVAKQLQAHGWSTAIFKVLATDPIETIVAWLVGWSRLLVEQSMSRGTVLGVFTSNVIKTLTHLTSSHGSQEVQTAASSCSHAL